MAVELAGYNRDTCRLYIGHILSHWSHDPHTFDEDLELWVDNFLAPGALEGGFAWYRGVDEARRNLVRHGAPGLPVIPHPTRILWGEHDPVLRSEWVDTLDDTFANLRYDIAPGSGHFVHYEDPELANREIDAFFQSVSGIEDW
jgi:pimeloyl-ACP methyl ester carboxylesterase